MRLADERALFAFVMRHAEQQPVHSTCLPGDLQRLEAQAFIPLWLHKRVAVRNDRLQRQRRMHDIALRGSLTQVTQKWASYLLCSSYILYYVRKAHSPPMHKFGHANIESTGTVDAT